MSRTKAGFAVSVWIAIVGLGVLAQAQTVYTMFAGSSAQWQTLALGTYNAGDCPTGATATKPCFHYTNGSFNLTDGRPTPPAVDTGGIWIVWDSAATPHVWAFIKVDSGVGNRCYFANPACVAGIPAPFPGPSNSISSTLWGDGSSDSTPPTSVQALFTSAGVKVNVSATDIRPEDSLWSTCRTNSLLGNGSPGSGDGTDGLGYGNNSSGICPAFGAAASDLRGNAVQSGYPSSTSVANVVAWNITGKDPFTGATVPKFTTYSVGGAPVVFVFERNGGQLKNLTNATDAQLQSVFSGTECNASALGLSSADIAVYLREPLSGTMNTTEATVFRRPTVPPSKGVLGVSQEHNVNGANPLTGKSVSCPGGGGRWRAIGTGEEVKSVQNSVTNNGIDGIGYTFFSYGNVSSIANNANYGYITLNGTDPIFQAYGSTFDPGQPATEGVLPAAANTPCGSFPCPENQIWAGGLSFPNVRSGTYRAWSLLRIVSTGAALTNAEKVIKSSQSFVVTTTPDYIPAVKVTATVNGKSFTDPGLALIRSHYQQTDGNGNDLGGAPVNTGTKEAGGDMGGCILSLDNVATGVVQGNPSGCVAR
jgi:hypothetical protein